MSPEPRTFGRTAAQSARAAILLALLGSAAVGGVTRYLTAPTGPLGRTYLATGLPEWLPLTLGIGCVLLLAAFGCVKSVREAPRFEVLPEGLRITGSLGIYVVRWDNVAALEATETGSLGISLKDRHALLATHQGTEQQREWLRTQKPFGPWDLLFPQADLGRSAAEAVEWLRPHLAGCG